MKKTKYDRKCLHLSPEEVEQKLKAGEDFVIRMKVPDGSTSFQDVVHGKVQFNNTVLDD